MTRLTTTACLASLLLGLTACTPTNNAAADEAAAGPRPLIVKLQTQTNTISVYASDSGPNTFDIFDESGKLLAEALDETEFASQYPEAFDLYRRSLAPGQGKPVDASAGPTNSPPNQGRAPTPRRK